MSSPYRMVAPYFQTIEYTRARRTGKRRITIAEWIESIETADFPRGWEMPVVSAVFPVGRFPQLYQEDEGGAVPVRHNGESGGWARSRYSIELKRAVWIGRGRRKTHPVL